MLSSKWLENLGDLRIARFDFEKAGDVLPMHTHSEDNVHITLVATGRVRAYGNTWSVEAGPGDLINFRPYEPHEIAALEDNTRIFNVVKKLGGVPPAAYDGVDPDAG
jgi:quercetin dioxygenase-like cupin family protein